jgi:hypothetical protein
MGESRHDYAFEVIMAGMRIRPPGTKKGTPNARRPATMKDFADAFQEAKVSHSEIMSLLDAIFIDVLRQAGATFETPPPIAEDAAE